MALQRERDRLPCEQHFSRERLPRDEHDRATDKSTPA
jgi:hypothetical protein